MQHPSAHEELDKCCKGVVLLSSRIRRALNQAGSEMKRYKHGTEGMVSHAQPVVVSFSTLAGLFEASLLPQAVSSAA